MSDSVEGGRKMQSVRDVFFAHLNLERGVDVNGNMISIAVDWKKVAATMCDMIQVEPEPQVDDLEGPSNIRNCMESP